MTGLRSLAAMHRSACFRRGWIDARAYSRECSHMAPEDYDIETEPDKTKPPFARLRFETPFELYRAMPQVAQLTQHRPKEDEDLVTFLNRLRSSATPEEAITFAAFAAQPKMAIWWGYECLRQAADDLNKGERQMMEFVANWTQFPDDENRYRAMQMGLYAPIRTPAVYLCLAVGWSGGPIAPNDPAGVPPHRTPRAINTAVLSCLARANLQERPKRLEGFTDQAVSMLTVY